MSQKRDIVPIALSKSVASALHGDQQAAARLRTTDAELADFLIAFGLPSGTASAPTPGSPPAPRPDGTPASAHGQAVDAASGAAALLRAKARARTGRRAYSVTPVRPSAQAGPTP